MSAHTRMIAASGVILTLVALLCVAACAAPAAHGASDTADATPDKHPTRILFQVSLPDAADSIPAYLANVQTAQGSQDVVFLTTRAGYIVALDAHTGVQIWQHQNGPGSCHINDGSDVCYTTSAPAIDPNGQFVYSYGLDGYVHKYAVGDGTETTGGGWPELATRKPDQEKGSSWLGVATAKNGTSYLYVANGGYPGDQGDYQGHLTTINLGDGSQHVFNAACSNQTDVHFVQKGMPDCGTVQTAIWSRTPVLYSPDTDRIYATTGNGTFDPANHLWGDTVFALNPDGTGANGDPLDTYTPPNFTQLQDQDIDIGSTAPVALPTLARSIVKHLAVQSGKDGKLRLLNLDDLSSQGGTGHTGGEIGKVFSLPQGGEVLTEPVAWNDPHSNVSWIFVASHSGLAGIKLTFDGKGKPNLRTGWRKAGDDTTPFVANGILYTVSSHSVQALNPHTGRVVWQDRSIGGIHWQTPLVANNILYIADGNGRLTAYTLTGLHTDS